MAVNTKMMKRVKGIGHNTLLFATIMGVAMFSQSADASVVSEVIESSDNDNHKIFTDIKPVSIMEESIVASTQNSKESVLSLDASDDTTVVSTLQATNGVLTANHVNGKVASSSVQTSSTNSSSVQTTTVQTSLRNGHVTGAAAPTPTLTTVKAESTSYLNGEHQNYELTTTQGTHTHSVVINGTTYYYTPDEDTPALNDALVNLANTGSVALTSSTTAPDNYVFKIDNGDTTFTYYSYDTDKLPVSVYEVADGTIEDYTFYTFAEDNLTKEYHKVALKTDEMSLPGSVMWSKDQTATAPSDFVFDNSSRTGSGIFKVSVPHNGTSEDEFYKVNYVLPLGYVQSGHISSPETSVENKYFYHISGESAIEVGSNIDTIKAEFILNSSGAIYLHDCHTVNSVIGNFIANSTAQSGGAIYTTSCGGYTHIGSVTGDFIGNTATVNGGAIAAGGLEINSLNGNFIGNSAGESGGAIYNDNCSSIGSLTADFIGNSAGESGGAISNDGTISSITGDFIGNSAVGYGGALYSACSGYYGSITGDFIGNSAGESGGALWANYAPGSITGDFIGNSAGSSGGAIYIFSGRTDAITGNFIGNSASSSGGAIYNEGTISSITGSFIGNSSNKGGAIYNEEATIGLIKGNFSENDSTAIYNYGSITDIDINASANSGGYGGAISNQSNKSITNITGTFTSNSAADGGAIYNTGRITSINANFTDNNASQNGGAIAASGYDGTDFIGTIAGTFTGNNTEGSGGAISTYAGTGGYYGNIGTINADFTGNYSGFGGGAINLAPSSTVGEITGNFEGNYVNTDYSGYGGAIYNEGTITKGIVNSTFKNNYVVTSNSLKEVLGGAIYTTEDLKLIADGSVAKNDGTFTISGNYVSNDGGAYRDYEAIYVHDADKTLTLEAKNGGKFFIDDYINGAEGYTVALTGDSTGSVGLFDDIKNGNVTVSGTQLNFANGDVKEYTFKKDLTVNGAITHAIDVDLEGNNADKIAVDGTFAAGAGSILIDAINLTSSVDDNSVSVSIATGGSDIANAYALSSNILANITAETGVSFDVDTVSYDSATGMLTFNKFISGGATLDDIRKETSEYLASDHNKYNNLVPTKDADHPDRVVINGTTYYFKASETDPEMTDNLREIASTSSYALKEVDADEDYVFTVGGKYYTYTPSVMAKSVWSPSDATATNYNFVDYDYDSSTGTVTPTYYNVTINTDRMGTRGINWTKVDKATADTYTWSDTTTVPLASTPKYTEDGEGGLTSVDGAIRFNLPHTTVDGETIDNTPQTQYYKYSYTVSGDKQARRDNLSGDVNGGYFYNNDVSASGGAINNNSTNGYNITADFINNRSNTGGAINNTGVLGDITGNFIANKAIAAAPAGAIFNTGSIGVIRGDFVNNISTNNVGGAIYSSGDNTNIDGIIGNFIGNYALVPGGAMYLSSKVGYINANFIGNSSGVQGGAIYSYASTIGSIAGDFIGNRANGQGGAIRSVAGTSIGSITGDFIGNSAGNDGGAIYSDASTIGSITGDFIGNSAGSISNGGAIYSSSTIGSITGDFIDNSAANGSGGAIYSDRYIGSINGLFSENYSGDHGGALYITGQGVGSIDADFVGNSSKSEGGAIHLNNFTSPIESISGDFINNTSESRGGAMYINGGINIGQINSNFIGNTANSDAGAIYHNGGTISSITGNFENNKALGGSGGAIISYGIITAINGNFTNNSSREGGAIISYRNIGSITGNFANNSATNYSYAEGGAIKNYGLVSSITGDFTGNTSVKGGAISNYRTIGTVTGDFKNNTATTGNGGAIYNYNDSKILNLVADDRNIEFYNNTANGSYNDIYGGKIDLSAGTFAEGQRTISFGGTLDNIYSLNINPTSSTYHDTITDEDVEITRPTGGKYIFNNAVNVTGAMNLYNNADVKLGSILQADNTTTTYGSLNVGSLVNDANGGSIDSQNGHIENNTIGAITLGSDLNMSIDAALSGTAQVDNIALNGDFTDNNHKLHINGINILSDSAYKHSRAQFLTSDNADDYAKVSGEGLAGTGGKYKYEYNTADGKIYFNNVNIKNLLTAVRDNDAEIIGTYRTYTLSANEDVHADASNFSAYETVDKLGSIAGPTGLTIDGSTDKYGINGSHTEGDVTTNYGGITVGAGKTLQLFRLGSVDSTTGAIINSVNGFKSANGGFVNNNGNLQFQNSVFANNSAVIKGGAIYNNGTISDTFNSVFDSNNAANGGAIFNEKTITSLSSNKFANNTATAHAGALYNADTINSLISSEFANNNAGQNGGAIYNEGEIKTLGANFTGNSASAGGAIYNTGLISALTGNFENNSASANGGAIHNSGAIVSLSGDFTGNSGAAIYNYAASGIYATAGIAASDSNVAFNNNKIGANYVDIVNNGGMIALNAKSGNKITFNGAIDGTNGTIELNRNSFTCRNPIDGSNITASGLKTGGTYEFNNTVSGNALNLNNGANVVLGSASQQDSTTSYGTLNLVSLKTVGTSSTIDSQNGHIDAHSLGNVNLGSNLNVAIDASINGTPQGDSFAIDSFTSGTSKLNINSVLLSSGSNYRHSDVQLITTTAGTPSYVYGRVTGSGVATNGEGVTGTYNYVYNATNGKLHFNNTAINNLMTAVKDGDVSTYILTGNENVRQDALTYSADTPTSLGTMFGSSLLIDGTSDNHYGIDASYVDGTEVKGHGGIFVEANKDLTAQHLGSATITKDANGNYIFDENGRVAESSIAVGNSVKGFNDVFIRALMPNTNITVDDVVFTNNNVTDLIHLSGDYGSKKITNSKFINNSLGGAITSVNALIETNSSVDEISHSLFANNTHRAIVVTSSGSTPLNLIDSVDFVGNALSYDGGGAAIAGLGGYIKTVSNTLFESNKANTGGAVYLAGSTIENGSNLKFLGNVSTINDTSDFGGGALAVVGGNIGNISSSVFSGNMANLYGGAVNLRGASVTFTDTNFNNNAAKSGGGAIYSIASTVNIVANNSNVVFENNYIGANASTVRNADGTYSVTGEGLTANDILNSGNLNLLAKDGRSITFNGTITDKETPSGVTTIGGTGYEGTVNFNDKVTQKSIVVKTGTVNAKAEDLVATDGIKNDALIVFNNTADGTIGSAITGDSGTGNIKIAATDGVTVKADKGITDQNVSVDSGILHLASGSVLGGASAVTVKNGAGINTIDNAINNYMTGTNVVTLQDGSRVYVDIDGVNIDTFAADSNATVTLANVNIKGAIDLHDGDVIQLISDGANATVEGTTLFVQQDGKTVAIQGSGQADGKVKVGESTSTKLNGAVDVSGAVDALTYSMSADEVVNQKPGQTALGEIKNSFIITSDNPTTSTTPGTNRTVHATDGTYGLIVKNGHSLTTNDITFENFATDDTYKGVITVESGAKLTVNNTTFKRTTNADNSNIVIYNQGTLISDPSHYEGGVMVDDGATASFSAGDTFENIDRSAYNGGAIINETTGQVTTNGVIFNNNKALNGGSIHTQGTTSSTGDTFTKNIAVQNGGAIYNSGVLTVSGASFGDGTEANANMANGGKGGAIYNGATGTLNVTDTSFRMNGAGVQGSVQGKGGAIYSEGNVNIASLNSDVIFDKNESADGSGTGNEGVGDAIYMLGTSTTPVTLTLNAKDDTNTIKFAEDQAIAGEYYNVNINNATGYTGTVELDTLKGANTVAASGGTVNAKVIEASTVSLANTNLTLTANSSANTLNLDNSSSLSISGTGTSFNAMAGSNSGDIKGDGTFVIGDDLATVTAYTNNADGVIHAKTDIKAGATLTTAGADSTTLPTKGLVSEVTNAGTLDVTGGTIFANVSGNGKLQTADGTAVNSTVTVEQKNLTVAGTLTNNGMVIVNDTLANNGTIANAGSLVLGGADMQNAGTINGAGTTEIAGKVTNSGTGNITGNDIVIGAAGELVTNAGKISDKDGHITNDGTLTLNGGSLADNVDASISGHTDIVGDVAFAGTTNAIYQKINILTGGKLTADGSNIDADVNNTVDGGLELISGTLTQNVSGTGSTTVKTTGTVANEGTIEQELNVTQGIFDNTTGSVTKLTTIGDGATAMNEGTLANVTNNGTFTNVSGSAGAVLNNKTANINGGSAGAITNNDTLAIAGGTVASVNNAQAASTATQSGGTVSGNVTNAGTYTITGGTISGDVENTKDLNFNGGAIAGNIVDSQATKTGVTTVDNNADVQLASGKSITQKELIIKDGAKLTAEADDIHTTANNISNDGTLAFTGGADTEHRITNSNTVLHTAADKGTTEFSGYNTNSATLTQDTVKNTGNLINTTGTEINASVDNDGVLTANASDINGTVDNSGTYTINGGNVDYAVSGTGHTDIDTTGVVRFNALVGQQINVNNGKLSTNADYIGGNVDNTGANSVILTGGTLGTDTDNFTVSSTDTTGTTQVTGNVTVHDGSKINEGVNIESTGKLTTAASGVGGNVNNEANDGLVLTGGDLAVNVNGSGSTEVAGAVTINNASKAIAQNVDITSGSLTANANSIQGNVVNAGADSLVLTGGTYGSETGHYTVSSAAAPAVAGTTKVTGNVTIYDKNSKINEGINIESTGSLTADAQSLGGDITNKATDGLVLKGGNLDNNVTGTGTTKVDGTVTINDSTKSVAQDINITSGSLTANADSVQGNVVNTGADSLVLTGGTYGSATDHYTVSTTTNGTTKIAGGDVEIAQGSAINEGINIVSGSLTANADSLGGDISNDASLILTGGGLDYDVTGNGGTRITGDVEIADSADSIAQGITIETTGSLTANGASIGGDVLNKADDGLVLTGGTLGNSTDHIAVTGDGTTLVDGAAAIAHGSSIAQDITINGGAGKSLEANADSLLGNTITNNGLLTVYSQETPLSDASKLNSDVTGNGKTILQRNVTVAGDVETEVQVSSYGTNNANVTVLDGSKLGTAGKDIKVDENNKLTLQNAESLQNAVKDDGTLVLESGTLSKNITDPNAKGTTVIDNGTVTNSADIQTKVEITDDGALKTATTGLSNTSDIKNDGTLTFNDTTAGDVTINSSVVKNTTGTGTLEIAAGADTNVVLASGKTISDNSIKFTSGTFNVTSMADANHNINLSPDAGINGLIANGGTLSVQDAQIGNINLGNRIDVTNSDLKLDMDLDLVSTTASADTLSGTIYLKSGDNGIAIDNLRLTTDAGYQIPVDVKVANADLGDNIKIDHLSVSNNAQVGSLLITKNDFSVTDGTSLHIEHSDLDNAITSTVAHKAYVMGDNVVGNSSGALKMNGETLSISGGTNDTMTGEDPAKDGIDVNGHSLTLNNMNVEGFDTAIVNTTSGGEVTLNNVTMTGNATADVENTQTLNAKGTNTIDTIVGTGGATNVNSGTTTVKNKLEQQELAIGDLTESTDGKFVNDGTVTVDFLDVITAGSEFENSVGQTATINSGLSNSGTVDNDGTLTAKSIDNDGTIENSNLLSVTDGIDNAGEIINQNGGSIFADIDNVEDNSSITNAADSSITGDIINTSGKDNIRISNAGTITGDINNGNGANNVLTNDATGLITGGTVTNAGGTVNNTAGGEIASVVDNKSGTVNTNADKVTGGVQNDGTVNLIGGADDTVLALGSDIKESSTAGTGIVNITGTVETNASGKGSQIIEQATINVGTDDGTTEVPGSLANKGTVESDNITVSDNSDINNTGSITANTGIDNKGTITNDGAAARITATKISNADEIINQNGGSIFADIDNVEDNSSITNAADSSITGDIINTSGKDNIRISNAGTITGDIDNGNGANNVLTNNATGLITGGTVTNAGGTVNNTAGGEIASVVDNKSGIVNTKADKVTGGVQNDGTVNLIGGDTTALALGSNIEDSSAGTGTGIVNITGTVETNASGKGSQIIEQATINVGTDDGTTETVGSLANKGTVESDNITVSDNSDINNTGSITANTGIDNKGTITNDGANATIKGGKIANADDVINQNGGVIENAIDNTAAGAKIDNKENSEIKGAVENKVADTTIDNAGTISGTVANASGADVNNTQSGTISGDVTNSGTLNNEGAITSTLTNKDATLDDDKVTNTGSIAEAINEAGGLIDNIVDYTDPSNPRQGTIDKLTNNGADGTTPAGVVNSTASGIITSADNDGILNLDGSDPNYDTIAAAITGDGHTNITGDVINNSNTFEQGDGITVKAGAADDPNSLSNNGTIVADVEVEDNALFDMLANSTATGDVTLDGDNSVLGVTDSGKLNGDVIADKGKIQVTAENEDSKLSQISGDIRGSVDPATGEPTDGSYIVGATSGGSGHNAVLDKAIAGATAIEVDDLTEAIITDDVFASNSTAPITVGDDSTVTLQNNSAGDMDVNNTIANAQPGDVYDVIVENTDPAQTTNLNNTVTGAERIVAKTGTTNINAGNDATATSQRIDGALIEVDDGATAKITSGAGTMTINNDVIGEGAGSTFEMNGAAGVPGSASNPGTIFNIANGNTISNAAAVLSSGQLNLPNESVLAGGSTLEVGTGATLNTINGYASPYNTPITFDNASQVKVDVDVLSRISDRFNNPTQAPGEGVVLTDLALQNLDKILYHTTVIPLNGTTNLQNVSVGPELLNKTFTAMTPIRRMTGRVDENAVLYILPSGGRNDYNEFNPAVVASSVAAQLGGYLTQLQSYDESFRNMDMYMLMTQEQRQAMKLRNKYAAAGSSKFMTFDPNQEAIQKPGLWVRPYGTFEKVSLKNGPRVSNVAYGSYFGGESELTELGNGWDGMFGVFVGYNGSHQVYDGVGVYDNGASLGATGMLYKGNFFTGLTASTGVNFADASTRYGSEDFFMMMAGIASKTGYNWELAKGKFIIQPSWTMSYSFVNTFDYTNSAGVRINTKPLNAINMEPGIKFIGNFKNGWQPYAGVSMVWNIMDNVDYHANDIALPKMHVKPYFKYGLGLRKVWGDRFTGYLQAYATAGGRTGVGLSAGFRWSLGKGDSKRKSITDGGSAVKLIKSKNKPVGMVKTQTPRKVGKIASFISKMDGDDTVVNLQVNSKKTIAKSSVK